MHLFTLALLILTFNAAWSDKSTPNEKVVLADDGDVSIFGNKTANNTSSNIARSSEASDAPISSSNTTAAARNPTVLVTGQTWLKHGELLDLDISCNGSEPWQYCWSIKTSPYNVTGEETCRDPQIMTTSCTFPVIWYFRTSGEYDVLLIVSDGAATVRKSVHVTVYDVQKQTPLSFVVVPICSALAAAVACAAGVLAFAYFKRNLAVETADFDFSSNTAGANADEEPKTFWERLRDSTVYAFAAASVSSVPGHLVMADIQYESIR